MSLDGKLSPPLEVVILDMKQDIKESKGGKREVEFILTVEEMQPYVDSALSKIVAEYNMPGFRKGQAPKDMILERVGKATILEAAAEAAIQKVLNAFAKEVKWEIIASPNVDIKKLAPDNDFVFKATFLTLPEVKLGDYKKLKVAKPAEAKITDEAVDKVLKDLQKMSATEAISTNPITTENRIMVDMEITKEGVVVEGGSAKNHSILMNESYYIPGLPEQLVGLSRGEIKEFDLEFPKNHYQKILAGQMVHFKMKINEIYERKLPELTDAFVEKFGQKTLEELKNILRTNLAREADEAEAIKTERAVLDELVNQSKFDELPDELISEETTKMLKELENNVTREGMLFADYLKSLKKDVATIEKDFRPEAEKRIQVMLALREIKIKEGIEATDADILAEQQQQLNLYKNDPEAQKVIRGDDYHEYLHNTLSNKKTITFLVNLATR